MPAGCAYWSEENGKSIPNRILGSRKLSGRSLLHRLSRIIAPPFSRFQVLHILDSQPQLTRYFLSPNGATAWVDQVIVRKTTGNLDFEAYDTNRAPWTIGSVGLSDYASSVTITKAMGEVANNQKALRIKFPGAGTIYVEQPFDMTKITDYYSDGSVDVQVSASLQFYFATCTAAFIKCLARSTVVNSGNEYLTISKFNSKFERDHVVCTFTSQQVTAGNWKLQIGWECNNAAVALIDNVDYVSFLD